MQFTSVIAAAVATLAVGSQAAAIGARDDRVAQFRIFGEKGCSNLNYGFYTVDRSQAEECSAFGTAAGSTGVRSVLYEQYQDPNCHLVVYYDSNCTEGNGVHPSQGVCTNFKEEPVHPYQSWKVECKSDSA